MVPTQSLSPTCAAAAVASSSSFLSLSPSASLAVDPSAILALASDSCFSTADCCACTHTHHAIK